MTALKVILAIALVLWLISLIRVGGVAEYHEGGLVVKLRLGLIRYTIYPLKPQKVKKPQKAPMEPPAKQEPDLKEKTGGALALLRQFLPLATEAAGRLKRKIRIEELILHLTWATKDPAFTAIGFGAGNVALGMIWPLLDHNFDIRKRDVGVAVDFDRTQPIVYLKGAFSMTIGQGTAFAVIYGVKSLRIWRANRKRTSVPKEKAA